MSRFWSGSTNTDGSDVDKVITIPAHQDKSKQIVIRSLRMVGGNAASDLRMFAWGDKGQTTTNTAAAANAGDLQLAGDSGANDTLNGEVYAAGDWVLVKLDTRRFLNALGSWQLMLIASVGGATSGTVDLATLTANDGENDPQNAVASGNTAFLMLAEDVYTEVIGSATKIFSAGADVAIFSGNPGYPVSVHAEAATGTTEEMQLTAEYV